MNETDDPPTETARCGRPAGARGTAEERETFGVHRLSDYMRSIASVAMF